MKKIHHLIRAVLFLAVLAVCFHFIHNVFRAKDEEELSPYYYDYPGGTFDVIIAGASVAKDGIQPVCLWQQEGIAAYNVSNANQSIASSYYMIRDAVERHKPKVIVLDVTTAEESDVILNYNSLHYQTDEMPFWDSCRRQMIQDFIPEEDRNEFYFPMYVYHARWKDLKPSDVRENDYQKYTLGAAIFGETMPSSATLFSKEDRTKELSAVSREYLEKIIQFCDEKNVSLLLLSCPAMGDADTGFDEDDYNDRRDVMRQVGDIAAAANVPFLNFLEDPSALGLELLSDFRNSAHLNIWGAEKLSSYLAVYLKEHYDLPDRTQDAAVARRLNAAASHYAEVKRRQILLSTNRCDSAFRDLTLYGKDADLVYLVAGQDFKNDEDLSAVVANGMTALGIPYDQEYNGLTNLYAVIDGGNLVAFDQQEVNTDVSYAGEINGMRFGIRTNAMAENEADHYNNILVRGGDYAPDVKGLAVAVCDKETGRVIDCMTFPYDGSDVVHYTEPGDS